MERTKGNVVVTLLVGSAAAAFALGALIHKWIAQSRSSTPLEAFDRSEQDARKVPLLNVPSRPNQTLFFLQAKEHVTRTSNVLSEWHDHQIGVRMQFSPSSLMLVHEERHAPVILLRFTCTKEPEKIVTCVIEECEDDFNAEDYRAASLEKIKDLVKVHNVTNVRVGTNVFPLLEYSYLSESNAVVFVASIFITHATIGITAQYVSCSPIPKTLPSGFHELVRTMSFFPKKPSSSYLFCAEPRLGLGFRVPLDFRLQSTTPDGVDETFCGDDSLPFATLISTQSKITVVAKYERHPQSSWATVLEKVLRRSYERFNFVGHVNFVFESVFSEHSSSVMVMRQCSISAPTSDVDFGWAGTEAEGSSRVVSGYFCFHEVSVNTTHSRDIGFDSFDTSASAYFCVYCIAIGIGEYVSIAFLSPRSHDLQNFVHFCNRVVDSVSLGNHYGQETSLTYCNMRHLHKFHLNLTNQLAVKEPTLGDPVCIVGSGGVIDTFVSLRIIPCPDDISLHSSSMDKFEADILQLVRQSGGLAFIIEHRRSSLSALGGAVLISVVHEHDLSQEDVFSYEDMSDQQLRNPLTWSDLQSDEPSEPLSFRLSTLICFPGKAFLFQTASNQYCFPSARGVLEDIVQGFALFKTTQ